MSILSESITSLVTEAKKKKTSNFIFGEFIAQSLVMADQIHTWHWVSDEMNAHEVLGDLYEKMREILDELVEGYISNVGDLAYTYTSKLTTKNSSKKVIIRELKEFRTLVGDTINASKTMGLPSVNDKLVELNALLDKSIYLLSMK